MPIVEGENTIEQVNTNSYNEINNTQEQNQIPQSTIATVEVTDEKAPIIFLFGAPNSGKTMTLVRLYRYLFKNQITIEAEKSFVTNDGDKYKEKCNKFTENANLDKAAEATKGVDFMLLKISDNATDICQILESPGEKLFHPDPNEDKGFPVKYETFHGTAHPHSYLPVPEWHLWVHGARFCLPAGESPHPVLVQYLRSDE